MRKPADQIVVEKIKEAILNRSLAPGTQLVEATISASLDISRTPIRNAFRKLEDDGYVTIIPNRGAFVVRPSRKEILQASELRIELECIAAKFALPQLTDEDVLELEKLEERVLEVYDELDLPGHAAMNIDFHLFMAKKSNNKYILEFLSKIMERIQLYIQMYGFVDYQSREDNRSLSEHQLIIEAIKAKDLELLQVRIREHLQATLEEIKKNAEGYQSIDELL